ncbi:hypothetical protein [uncultured Umboniibacter sp.]|uniref:hypothetical protein n=1 Tax=uncultured Umboniibacter sp. TaxID=1798917 RepID=UPI00260E2E88|nr:hypothetical protein [uncultured Umboniibacter sp.]
MLLLLRTKSRFALLEVNDSLESMLANAKQVMLENTVPTASMGYRWNAKDIALTGVSLQMDVLLEQGDVDEYINLTDRQNYITVSNLGYWELVSVDRRHGDRMVFDEWSIDDTLSLVKYEGGILYSYDNAHGIEDWSDMLVIRSASPTMA